MASALINAVFGPLRRLYQWTLSWAEHRYAQTALFALALAESSFFPIPPDVLGLALCAGKPKKSFVYAGVCSLGSVVGGALGYMFGAFLWTEFQNFFYSYIPGFSPELFERVRVNYEAYGFWLILAAAFTPIPYKVFTVSAGVFGIGWLPFILASSVGRTARFYLWGSLIYFFGPGIKAWIDRYFELAVTLFMILLIGGFWVVKKLAH